MPLGMTSLAFASNFAGSSVAERKPCVGVGSERRAAGHPAAGRQRRAIGVRMCSAPNGGVPRRDVLKVAGAAAVGSVVGVDGVVGGNGVAGGSSPVIGVESAIAAPKVLARPNWEQVALDTDSTVFDIAFSPRNPKRGWLVGTKGLVMETVDGGVTWEPRTFKNLDAEDEFNFRFETVSFYGNQGWVIGKPSILLKTIDGGKSWARVPLSPKLPGEPVLVTALGVDEAEMTTTAGAIYRTENGGRNWKAMVRCPSTTRP